MSTIEVIASGSTGEEEFVVEINGEVVGQFAVSTEPGSYFVQVDNLVSPLTDVIRVEFVNDLFIAGQVDRDLYVDKVVVDGVAFESESPTTYSTGTWVGEGIPNRGFLQSETLHVNGFFEYEAEASQIVVRASGTEGVEQLVIHVNREPVAEFEVSTEFQTFSYRNYGQLTLDQVRLVFDGDTFDADNDFDTNLVVDWIEFDGQRFETESETVYSTGTYLPADGVVPGFGRGDTLHTDGFFQYAFGLQPDVFSIPEDCQNVPLNVIANDNIVEAIEIEISTPPQNGTAIVVDGVIYYRPNSEFVGADSMSYREIGEVDDTEISISVNPSHSQPQHLLNDRVASELTPSGATLLVQKYAKLPREQRNRQPRMNMMALQGDRMFVVTDGSVNGEGNIYEVFDEDGVRSVELFFDVGSAVFAATGLDIDNSTPLNGLRSVAFHPDFESNGKFYVTYTGQRPDDPSQFFYLSDPENPVATESVIAEFTFDFGSNTVDETSYRELFRVGMRNSEHAIRQAVFNKYSQPGDEDYGLLYIGHGDGSEQSVVSGDGLNNDGLGKVLRVNPLQEGTNRYTVPDTNPFVGDPDMIDEAFAIGFRNPHNLSFAKDAVGVPRLLVTEVGRDNIEEINVVERGGSYGWGNREGPFVHNPESGTINGLDNLPANEVDNGFIFPNSFLGHDGIIGQSFVGQAIAGSHVIQNGSVELDGQFIFVEFATDGRAYHVDYETMLQQVTKLDPNNPERDSPEDLTWTTPQELTILFDHDSDVSTPPLVRDSLKDVLDDEPDFVEIRSAGKVRADLRLGEGPNGELFILNKRNGWIYWAVNTLAIPNEEPEVLVELVDSTLMIMGTDGRDEIQVIGNEGSMTVVANGRASTWTQLINQLEVLGGDGVDVIVVDVTQDVLVDGGKGADTIISGVGNDTLIGGAGNDTIFGGPGNDQIFGNNGSDVLSGGSGLDEIKGGGGSDELSGGQGEDLLIGGTGFDLLQGGADDDDLRGGQGQDVLEGGQGNDRLRGNEGNDQLNGNADDDRLTGGDGIDFMAGGPGVDSATDRGEAGETGIEN